MMRASQSYQLYPKVKFELLRTALMRHRDGETLISLKKYYPKIYKRHKAYAVIVNEGSVVLVVRPTNGEFETVDITTLKQMTFFERAYSDIQRHHVTDHSKGRTLHARISEVIHNMPRDVCKIYTDSCPLCIQRQLRTRPVAGLRPIVTSGFGTRVQVDLIDFQSIPDGTFHFLLNYCDHGVKFLFRIPIVRKRASCIAIALLEIFTIVGPPMILQLDNGREFSGAAMNSQQNGLQRTLVLLSDNDIDEIITEIRQLWPECRMVRDLLGTHSPMVELNELIAQFSTSLVHG
jgi:hypothetical protein